MDKQFKGSKDGEALKRRAPEAGLTPEVPPHCPGGSPRRVCDGTETQQRFGKALEPKGTA